MFFFKEGTAYEIRYGLVGSGVCIRDSMEAVFHRFDGQERAIVLLNMLHKQHRLTLALKDISTV